MAKNTNTFLRRQTIYQIFPRQHSKTQNFLGVIKDLDRIKNMGIDIIYFLPIHPIGIKARKGEKGSPYSIVDYYQIDSNLGTLEDFKLLIKEAHKRDMKVMIDIVYNHTSRDSILTKEHPNWFYRDDKGNFINRIGDWSDITDLNFEMEEVRKYLIDNLKYWANIVDGIRADVAPLIPIDFWIDARKEIDKIKPNFIWLSESVEYGFIKYLRDIGYDASSDSMIYDAFDIAYDYDIYSFMNDYLKGKISLKRWLYEIFRQEVVYPKNYIKLRSFENHDQERIASKTKSKEQLIQLTAFQFFIKGTPMIYGGQEHLISKRVDLFNDDIIKWDFNNSIEPLIKKLTCLKKREIFEKGSINILNDDEIAVLKYEFNEELLIGIFNLDNKKEVLIPLRDGKYINILNGLEVEVKNNKIKDLTYPIILDLDKNDLM